MSYDELTDVLNEWLTPGDNEEGEETSSDTISTSDLKSEPKKDTSEAFDELFNS